ncbi:MAG: DUF6056 family protein [Bifidobacterium crudilactis]|nr:DUF6056 family protein [Bifidobacterium crudilactis]
MERQRKLHAVLEKNKTSSGRYLFRPAIINRAPLLLVVIYGWLLFTFNPANLIDADAKFFSKVQQSPLQFSIDRYFAWSSRFWIEGATVVSSKHTGLFLIVSSLMTILLLFSVSGLLRYSSPGKNVILASLSIAIFPILSFNSAGWIATTVNYLWPTALFAFWVYCSEREHNRKVHPTFTILAFLCLLLSLFSEVTVLALLSYMCIQFCRQKSRLVKPYFIVTNVFLVIGVLNVLLCPGNAIRTASETRRWFPQYADFSAINRLTIQLSHMCNDLFTTYPPLLLVLVLALICSAIVAANHVALCLLICSLMLRGIAAPILSERFSSVAQQLAQSNLSKSSIASLYSPTVLATLSLLLILVAILNIYGWSEHTLLLDGALAASFVIGLFASKSPTLVASLDRPYIVLYFVMVIICSFIISDAYRLMIADVKSHTVDVAPPARAAPRNKTII